jgi:hypothetical protein
MSKHAVAAATTTDKVYETTVVSSTRNGARRMRMRTRSRSRSRSRSRMIVSEMTCTALSLSLSLSVVSLLLFVTGAVAASSMSRKSPSSSFTFTGGGVTTVTRTRTRTHRPTRPFAPLCGLCHTRPLRIGSRRMGQGPSWTHSATPCTQLPSRVSGSSRGGLGLLVGCGHHHRKGTTRTLLFGSSCSGSDCSPEEDATTNNNNEHKQEHEQEQEQEPSEEEEKERQPPQQGTGTSSSPPQEEEEVAATTTMMIPDLAWRVEKVRLETQHTKRFLRSGPRHLSYDECRKWVIAMARWSSLEEWNEWIDMGEKRNAYIPNHPQTYYTKQHTWISWDHFLGVHVNEVTHTTKAAAKATQSDSDSNSDESEDENTGMEDEPTAWL